MLSHLWVHLDKSFCLMNKCKCLQSHYNLEYSTYFANLSTVCGVLRSLFSNDLEVVSQSHQVSICSVFNQISLLENQLRCKKISFSRFSCRRGNKLQVVDMCQRHEQWFFTVWETDLLVAWGATQFCLYNQFSVSDGKITTFLELFEHGHILNFKREFKMSF